MPDQLAVTCECGTVAITVTVPTPRSGSRVMCYCKDCQTAARHLGAADRLTDAGGTEIFQTTPDHLRIDAGAEHLHILRLSPKGLFRWYAACCQTPLFNSLPKMGLPFVGVILPPDHAKDLPAALGPVICHHGTSGARPGAGAPPQDQGVAKAGMAMLLRMIRTALSGRGKSNPLRRQTGDPIAPITVLTLDQRNAARPPGA